LTDGEVTVYSGYINAVLNSGAQHTCHC